MKTRTTLPCQLMALTLLACCCFSALAVAQNSSVNDEHAVGRFVVLPAKPALPGTHPPAGTLEEWNGSFTYNSHNYPYVMVGTDPSTNSGAEITTWIVPVKLILSNGDTFDPLSGGPNSALARTILSPMFDSTTTYTQGGVDVGTTQYNDAFQRGNFWSIVQNEPNYHVLLGGATSHVSVLPELTINVPAADGHTGTAQGHTVGLVDIDWFDGQISTYMAQNPTINPAVLPIFEAANMYWTEGSCCIGGYHSANGTQSYSVFTYLTYTGVFSQDVSALSHEISEWMDDPLTPHQNNTPCGILEVGDPLEGGQPGHPYGTWTYELNNFTYHLQDLVLLRYFGAPSDLSVNDYWTFQGYTGITQICEDGS